MRSRLFLVALLAASVAASAAADNATPENASSEQNRTADHTMEHIEVTGHRPTADIDHGQDNASAVLSDELKQQRRQLLETAMEAQRQLLEQFQREHAQRIEESLAQDGRPEQPEGQSTASSESAERQALPETVETEMEVEVEAVRDTEPEIETEDTHEVDSSELEPT